MACHSVVTTCDHLTDILKVAGHDSHITTKIKLHGSMCSTIIKNVLSPHFQDDLFQDIEEGQYSLF